MADTKSNDNDSKSTEGVDDSEEENEILEESPCGRWLKRREQVEQRDIPGIDATYLAMDTEEGVEVVWNEVRFSERKYFKTKEETINEVFDRLIQLEHPNIVKLHKYWVHKDVEKPRVIFITEYMSSGSLKQFLRKTKKNLIRMALNAWKRWCTQTLSALCYLHSSQPPIVHGNLNCDTIFISYNGLIKIGAVAPDAIHKHVKTVRGDSKANLHYVAPEIGCISDSGAVLSPAVDIYSFGMCALEMAALEISPNGETSHITDDVINTTIESLDNPLQKDFIMKCLNKSPVDRPSARELLFHPIIFEVPSLKLFAAHVIVNTSSFQPEQLTEEAISRVLCLQKGSDRVLAECVLHNESRPNFTLKQSDSPKVEFEKFFEEVRNGSFPLTAIVTTTRPPLISRQRTMSPEVSGESTKQLNSPDNPYDEETRRVLNVNSTLEPSSEANTSDKRLVISLHIIFDDKINRKLSTKLEITELIPSSLAQELVFYGFINKEDQTIIFDILSEIKELFVNSGNHTVSCQKSQQLSPQQSTQNVNTTPVSQQSKPAVTQPQIPTPTQTPAKPPAHVIQQIPPHVPQPTQISHQVSIPISPTPQQLPQVVPQVVPQIVPQVVSQVVPQSVTQPTSQPIATIQQTIPQTVAQTLPHQITQTVTPVPQLVSPAITQNITPLVTQPIAQTVPQQIYQTIPPQILQSIPQTMTPVIYQPIPQSIYQPIPQTMPQQLPQTIPHQMTQTVPQVITPTIAQSIQQSIQQIPQQIIQPKLQSIGQPVLQPIQSIPSVTIQAVQPVPQQRHQFITQPVTIIAQPTVSTQVAQQTTIRTTIPTQTQIQTIPPQTRIQQQVNQQSNQQPIPTSASVASQTVDTINQTEKKTTVEEQRKIN